MFLVMRLMSIIQLITKNITLTTAEINIVTHGNDESHENALLTRPIKHLF